MFRNMSSYSPTSTHTVKLHDADPGADGTANEVDDTGYSEATYSGGWDAPAEQESPNGSVIANTTAVNCGTADASFTATHVTIWDTNSPENLLYAGALSDSVPFADGNAIEFPIGNLKLGLQGFLAPAGDGDGDGDA